MSTCIAVVDVGVAPSGFDLETVTDRRSITKVMVEMGLATRDIEIALKTDPEEEVDPLQVFVGKRLVYGTGTGTRGKSWKKKKW